MRTDKYVHTVTNEDTQKRRHSHIIDWRIQSQCFDWLSRRSEEVNVGKNSALQSEGSSLSSHL